MTESRGVLAAIHTQGAIVTVVLAVVAGPLSVWSQQPRARSVRHRPMAAQAGTTTETEGMYTPLIFAGQTLPGELNSASYRFADSVPFAVWTYTGKRDERVAVTAQAGYRAAVFFNEEHPDGTEITLSQSDTNSTNPSLELKLPEDGTYWVGFAGASPAAEGAYTINVKSYGSVSAFDWTRVYPGGGDPAERYALLVGVGAYPDTINSLGIAPLNDVALMRDLLITKFHFNPENIVTLRDVEGNREQIIQAFRRHLGQAGPTGVAVFYYSGHGLEMPDNRYIQDPEPTGKDQALAVWGTNGDRYGYILDDEMGILVGDLDAGRVLVILDDCYSGNQTRGPGVADWRTLAGAAAPPSAVRATTTAAHHLVAQSSRGLKWRNIVASMDEPDQWVHSVKGRTPDINVESALTEPANHVLLAASADSEESGQGVFKLDDGRVTDEGAFTLSLYGELKAAPISLTFAGAMADVKRAVLAYSKETGKVQTPQVEGKDKFKRIAAFLAKR